MVRNCGACLALLAFGTTILRGLAADNPPEATLVRALWALGVFLIVGLAVGWVGQIVIEEHHRQQSEKETQPREPEGTTSVPVVGAAAQANGREPSRLPEGPGVRAEMNR
jgi:NhaP-type Na+/H+ or K+/H+ antiporter